MVLPHAYCTPKTASASADVEQNSLLGGLCVPRLPHCKYYIRISLSGWNQSWQGTKIRGSLPVTHQSANEALPELYGGIFTY